MSKHHVTTTINGEPTEFLCEPQLTLLDVLRDELKLTGSKEGCSSGDCGACSVTLDGRLVCSCLVLAVEADGHKVDTVEGIARGHDLHPLQQKFLEHAALQCGFCTPGLLVATKALLEHNPFPDHPPHFLRAVVYDYHFTTPAERSGTGAWWKRERLGLYYPVVSLKDRQ